MKIGTRKANGLKSMLVNCWGINQEILKYSDEFFGQNMQKKV